MKKRALVASLFLLLTGCEEMSGTLYVSESFKAFVNGRQKEISVGNFETKLNIKREKIVATIKTPDADLKVNLNIPANVTIPENGPFELKANESGQLFDTRGYVRKTVTRSENKTGTESCQYTSQEPICNQNGCTIQTVIKNGWRSIEYYDENTVSEMQFSTLNTASGRAQASFNGSAEKTKKIVLREGMCF